MMVGRQENSVLVVDNPTEGTIAGVCIVVVGNMRAGIGRPEDQKMMVVKQRAVGKLPQAANTGLVRLIHNSHLVKRHKWLEEQYMAKHYSRKY